MCFLSLSYCCVFFFLFFFIFTFELKGFESMTGEATPSKNSISLYNEPIPQTARGPKAEQILSF